VEVLVTKFLRPQNLTGIAGSRTSDISRIIFGQHEAFQGVTEPEFLIAGLTCSQPPHGNSDLLAIFKSFEDPTNKKFDGRKAFRFHVQCFQYLECVTRFKPVIGRKQLFEKLWTLGLSLSPIWGFIYIDYGFDNSRAQRSVDDSMLDRRSLKLQRSIAATCNPGFADFIHRISILPDELIVKISQYMMPCPYAQLLQVFSQVCNTLEYICKYHVPVVNSGTPVGLPEKINLKRKIYYSKIRFAGSSYLTNLNNSPFPGSELLPAVENGTSVISTCDKTGIVGLEIINHDQGARKQNPPRSGRRRLWYQLDEIPIHQEAYLLRFERKVSLFVFRQLNYVRFTYDADYS
jgi:hypothetical protein